MPLLDTRLARMVCSVSMAAWLICTSARSLHPANELPLALLSKLAGDTALSSRQQTLMCHGCSHASTIEHQARQGVFDSSWVCEEKHKLGRNQALAAGPIAPGLG